MSELLKLQTNRHPLFTTVIQRSKDLKRPISCFRTKRGNRINLYPYPASPEGPNVFVSRFVMNLESYVEIRLSLIDGVCEVRERKILQGPLPLSRSVQKWLDRFNEDLIDENTVRINPYHPEEVLTDEEAEIDRYFSQVIGGLGRFSRALERSLASGATGIITPRDDAELN